MAFLSILFLILIMASPITASESHTQTHSHSDPHSNPDPHSHTHTQDSDHFHLTIMHTNDVHTSVEPFNTDHNPCTPDDITANHCYGGVARQMTKVQEFRDKGENVLLVDAGDQFEGTVWYRLKKWEAISKYMNYMKYDAMTFGKHEFYDGLDGLVSFIHGLDKHMAIVSSNVKSEGTKLHNLYKPYHVVDKGQKIAITGITKKSILRGIPIHLEPKDIEMDDELKTLKKVIEEDIIGKEKINKVIVLSQTSLEMERKICKEVKGVDIVIGGSTHSFMYNGDPPKNTQDRKTTKLGYPEVYNNTNGHLCLLATSFQFGKYIGHLPVTFDKDGNLLPKSYKDNNPILLDKEVGKHPGMLKELEKFQHEVTEYEKITVAETQVELNGARLVCRNQECNVGNMLTDALVEFYTERHVKREHKTKEEQECWTEAAIGIWNGGYIREFHAPAHTELKMSDLLKIMQFPNYIHKMRMTGSDLKAALNRSVSVIDEILPGGPYLQVSGIRVVYDMSREGVKDVKSIEVQSKRGNGPGHYELVKDNEYYHIATITFIAKGGDGYRMFEKYNQGESSKELDIDVIKAYLNKHKTIKPKIEGRIKYDYGHDIGMTQAPLFHLHPKTNIKS